MKIKKKSIKKKKIVKKKSLKPLDLGDAQKVAIKALLSTFAPNQIIHSPTLPKNPDEIMSLIYAGANHLALRVKDKDLNSLNNPTEMRVRVKHDPEIEETQIGFSFFRSIFTVYTPEDISQKISPDRNPLTLEDLLRNQLIDRLPSAGVRLALTIAEVCSQGGRLAYIQRFLPKDLRNETFSQSHKKKAKKKTLVKKQKKKSRKIA